MEQYNTPLFPNKYGGKLMAANRIVKNMLIYQYKRLNNNKVAPHPYKPISVDPQEIVHLPVPKLKIQYDLHHFGSWVIDGEWHTWPISDEKWHEPYKQGQIRLKFDNYVFYCSLKQSLLNGVPWEDTNYYQWAVKNERFSKDWLLNDFRKTKRVYNKIKDEGYKTQSELYKMPFRGKYDEVRVSIDATGNIEFFGGGRHRLSIAKMLDIGQIPVRVVVRHTQWQKKRELVAKTDCLEDIPDEIVAKLDHPDLQNVY